MQALNRDVFVCQTELRRVWNWKVGTAFVGMHETTPIETLTAIVRTCRDSVREIEDRRAFEVDVLLQVAESELQKLRGSTYFANQNKNGRS